MLQGSFVKIFNSTQTFWSRQCGILNILQPYRPPRPVTGVALLSYLTKSSEAICRFIWLEIIYISRITSIIISIRCDIGFDHRLINVRGSLRVCRALGQFPIRGPGELRSLAVCSCMLDPSLLIRTNKDRK
jgi:hypothetical protein